MFRSLVCLFGLLAEALVRVPDGVRLHDGDGLRPETKSNVNNCNNNSNNNSNSNVNNNNELC